MSICPIEKLIQFDLLDDCIHTPAGYYHFTGTIRRILTS